MPQAMGVTSKALIPRQILSGLLDDVIVRLLWQSFSKVEEQGRSFTTPSLFNEDPEGCAAAFPFTQFLVHLWAHSVALNALGFGR